METFGAKMEQTSVIALKIVHTIPIKDSSLFEIKGDIVPFEKIEKIRDIPKINQVQITYSLHFMSFHCIFFYF